MTMTMDYRRFDLRNIPGQLLRVSSLVEGTLFCEEEKEDDGDSGPVDTFQKASQMITVKDLLLQISGR